MGRAATAYADTLAESLRTPWKIGRWEPGDPPERLQDLLSRADAVALGADAHTHAGFSLMPYRLHAHDNIRLVQCAFSSHDWLQPGMLPRGATACNVQAHAITISEYVLAALLDHAVGLRQMDSEMRAGDWRHSGALFGLPHGELHERTLGLIGFGSIGTEVARRASAFGMRVIATGRRAREAPAGVDWIGGPERLDELLSTSDYIVVACDLNDQTRGLLDAARIARMKPGAFLVSVTRAHVLDEQALFDALRERRIAGAALDVWYRYPASLAESSRDPRPSRLDFHTLDNVVMTPHASAWTRAHHLRRWRHVAANLDRLARGEPLREVVMPTQASAPVAAA